MTVETEDGTWECRRVDSTNRAMVSSRSEDPSVALTTFVESAGTAVSELGSRLVRNDNEVCIKIDGNSQLMVTGWFVLTSVLCALLVTTVVYFVTKKSNNNNNNNNNEITTNNNGEQTINQLVITQKELGRGSHGTVVFAGRLGVRRVAVKRMLKEYFSEAGREISLLIRCDKHPNVLRYFAMESQGPFLFLALELCEMSLADAIEIERKKKKTINNNNNIRITKGIQELMRGLVSGVKYLHESYIVHRDIKPQNVLLQRVINNSSSSSSHDDWASKYVAKLSDMGLGKQLRQHRSSWRGGGTVGTAGWQAPEVLRAMLVEEEENAEKKKLEEKSSSNQFDRLGRAVDVWSMGCVLYTTACLGLHPFGKWYEREKRILERRFEAPLQDLVEVPEFRALMRDMISSDPIRRPTCEQILNHPFFWSSERKLRFLVNFSDRASGTKSGSSSIKDHKDVDLISELERYASVVFAGNDWTTKLPECLIVDLENRRRYNTKSVVDCVRMIRNRANHFRELTPQAQTMLSPFPKRFVEYFTGRKGLFPKLLLHCWEVSNNRKSSLMMNSRRYRPPNVLGEFSASSNFESCRVKWQRNQFHKTKLCKFILESGTCPRGSSCRYAHDESELVVTTTTSTVKQPPPRMKFRDITSSESSSSSSSSPSSDHATSLKPGVRNKNYKTFICREWKATGECKFASKCIFAHGYDELREH